MRVIKATNGPDIGRKVKVKASAKTIPPPPSPSSYVRGYRELTSSIPASSNSQRMSTNKPATSSNSSNSHSTTTRVPEKKVSDVMRRPLK